MIRRRRLLQGLAACAASPALAQPPLPTMGDMSRAQGGPLGLTLTESQIAAGHSLLTRHPSVDLHAHPGHFFLRDDPDPTPVAKSMGAPFEDRVAAQMPQGGVSAALFAGVSDARLLAPSPKGLLMASREFAPGEAYADYRRQLGLLKAMVARGLVARGRGERDIEAAFHAHRTACVFSIEGGDFIEDRLERVAEAQAEGVRAVTIVHYHLNQIGDPQTSEPHWRGLSPLGRDIVRAMNRARILVDLAHASFETSRDAVAVSDRPMMISHTNLQTPDNPHPRLITADHARMIASHDGLIGSVPSGIGQKTFADWVASILRLVDLVGVDHVAIGTDMDANYMPVFDSYVDWPLVPAALLAHGLSEAETAKIMGGNFLRLFAAVQA